jgi:cytochrome c-type biogenesis protein CcmE
MDENPNITVWPPGLRVATGDVSLYKSKIKRLPDGFTAPNDLILTDSELEELPQGLKVGGNLDIRGTSLQLRDDIEVGGHIRMKVKFWGDIPDKFRNGRKVLSF